MKENERYHIDSFWTEASTKLDQHFARKRAVRRLRIIGIGAVALFISVLAFVIGTTDFLNPSAQKMEKSPSKNELEKAIKIDRSVAAQRITSEKSGVQIQSISEKSIKAQQQSHEGDGNNKPVKISEHRDKSTNLPVNTDFSSEQNQNVEKVFSDSEKSTASNFEGTSHEVAPVLKIDNSEKKSTLVENVNTSNSSGVEADQVEAVSRKVSVNSHSTDSSDSKIESVASNTISGGIVPELNAVKKSSWEWAIVPSVGVFNSVKQLMSASNESAYITRRTQEEENTFRESFRLGLELSKNRLTLQSGIYISVYGERTAYNNWLMRTVPDISFNNQVVYDTTLSLVSYLDMGNFYEIAVSSVDSSVQTISDTTMVTSQTGVDAQPFHVQNRISYIEIPFSLRYTAYRNSLVDLGISAGGSIGFLRHSRGYVVNSSLDEFVQLDASAGLQKIIGNARIAADVRFILSDNLLPLARYCAKIAFVRTTKIGVCCLN
jgi:Na+-transporting methylmalonyl-CoA/oxaloacetate decarboxylase gamma subunit